VKTVHERTSIDRNNRRAHLPIIIESGMLDAPVKVPWWNGSTLRILT